MLLPKFPISLSLISFLIAVNHTTFADSFQTKIRPILKEYCVTCHNSDDALGELDLSHWTTSNDVLDDGELLGQIRWQIDQSEMPPKDADQLTNEMRSTLLKWIDETETAIAERQAGDPGPITLRRLSNHEYTYTIRDLTGIDSLDPAKEFPVDGAAGEGFTNVGSALVMSPGLLTKYLDAAKEIASHAVLLPDRITFSPSTSRADWTQEKLDAIRSIYSRYATSGDSSAQNLQGVQFSTVDAAIIPLDIYLSALIAGQDGDRFDAASANGDSSESALNSPQLSTKYLATLQSAVTSKAPTILVKEFQNRVTQVTPETVGQLRSWIQAWQNSLWYFGKVGHIGKRDGPTAWQNAVSPIATQQQIRQPLSTSNATSPVTTLNLVAHTAGDGNQGDIVNWKNANIITRDNLVIPLTRSQEIIKLAEQIIATHLQRTPEYLSLLTSPIESPSQIAASTTDQIKERALARGLNQEIALAWQKITETIRQPNQPTGHLTDKISDIGGYADIRGWGRELPTVLTNRSSNDLSFSTLRVPGRAVTVHPTPDINSVIDWKSPTNALVKIEALIADMDSVCGNGVAWSLDWIHELGTTTLSSGKISNGQSESIQLRDPIQIKTSDLIRLTVSPMDRDHTCDTTQVGITIQSIDGSEKKWDLAADIVDRIHDGNPLADGYGNVAVWHLCQSTDIQTTPSLLHPQSTLAQTLRDSRLKERADSLPESFWISVTQSLTNPQSDADRETSRNLKSLLGPFPWLSIAMTRIEKSDDSAIITQQAPSVLRFSLPTELANQATFSASVSVADNPMGEGSVQVQAITGDIEPQTRLLPGTLIAASAAPGTSWTAGQTPMVSSLPILVLPGGAAFKRIDQSINDFLQLFPAALCYSRIVPVDEVVTLTLRYREDDQLARLMLSDTERQDLERHWSDLWFISRHANKQKDAFDQLWQYATQDADPSAFEPMREPIEKAVETFNQSLLTIHPAQVQAATDLANRVWRRPITETEAQQLELLYHGFLAQGLSHEAAIRQLISRLFVAPEFLYRIEKGDSPTEQPPTSDLTVTSLDPRSPAAAIPMQRLSDFELASRLSYFLWSSCPDTVLDELATRGELASIHQISTQVERMVRDPKIRRFATEFGCQWLGVRNLAISDEKSERHFPSFRNLREDMQEEVTQYWIYLLQSNRSPMELIQSDTTLMNGPMAQLYGLDESIVAWSDLRWQQVHNMQNLGRGGVLGFAATLAQNSGASRTSPILRGNWISETLLGERLPKPPKDVPILPETTPDGLTEREMIERHSSDPNCARCHQRIDPFGFALENFDAIGRQRPQQNTRTQLPDGFEIDGIRDLQKYLIEQRGDEFLRQFSRKLLGYAIGRSIQLSDRPLIDQMVTTLKSSETKGIQDAILLVVQSTQFTHKRNPTGSEPLSQETRK